MNSYMVYVHDRRYRTPTLLVADFAHVDRAAAFAAERLASSPHYFAIEVWRDDALIVRLDKETA
ncbi:MAG TPA: hypothetical protein VG939_13155 [Caulobacteraceae bacterium]|nr:hypothetical protein [Caulobacteraceae bacterium]